MNGLSDDATAKLLETITAYQEQHAADLPKVDNAHAELYPDQVTLFTFRQAWEKVRFERSLAAAEAADAAAAEAADAAAAEDLIAGGDDAGSEAAPIATGDDAGSPSDDIATGAIATGDDAADAAGEEQPAE